MLPNPTKTIHFLNGLQSYHQLKYTQAATSFLSSMIQQLTQSHQFTSHQYNPTLNHVKDSSTKKQLTQKNKQKLILPSLQSLVNLSCSLLKLKLYPQAEKVSYRALYLNPYISLPYYNLTSIHIRSQNYINALNSISSALSCQYLKKYERTFEKNCLDKAIALAPNNVSAIKYRITCNLNLLKIIQSLKNLSGYSVRYISNSHSISGDSLDQKEITMLVKEIHSDMESLKKLNIIYEVRFTSNNSQHKTQNTKQETFLISTTKPQFILQAPLKNNSITNFKNNKSHQNNQLKLQILQNLKKLREQYLQLVKQNSQQVSFQEILDSQFFQQDYSLQINKNIFCENTRIEQQNKPFEYDELKVPQHSYTLQTSFELQDSLQTYHQEQGIPQKQSSPFSLSKSKRHRNKQINNKENIQHQYKNPTSHYTRCQSKSQHKKDIVSNKNKKIGLRNRDKNIILEENEQMRVNSSVISIQDYEVNHSNQLHPNVNLIQSVIVHSPQNQSIDLFEIQQKPIENNFSLVRNRSCETLINTVMSPYKNLKHSQYLSTNMLSQSQSHLKLMCCSKCSIDKDNEENKSKNVKLQINLTQIYNYPCDYSQLQTFCIIKHNNQQLKTQLSKGKFPNWKQSIYLQIDHLQTLNCSKFSHYCDTQCQENKYIKIQLWAKNTHSKKDQTQKTYLVGQHQINLKDQKWTKRKITLQNKLHNDQKKKTAYMFISLQKLKNEKQQF